MNEKDFADLAAGAALHALTPEDLAAFEAARAQHPEWEHHVDTDAATAAHLAENVAEVAPPPELRAALLESIAATTDEREHPPPATAPRRWGTRAWFALAASLALLVGVGWGAVFVGDMLNTPASVVALERIEAAPDAQSETVAITGGGEATAYWSSSLGTAVLVTDGLPELTEEQAFELWYVRDGSAIPAGVFTSEDGAVTALLNGSVEPGDVIALTVEQSGGSPTGQPTTTPIVAIQTA